VTHTEATRISNAVWTAAGSGALAAVFVALAFVWAVPAHADQSGYDYPPPVAPEAAKAPLIRELFRTRPLTLRYAARYRENISTADDAVYGAQTLHDTPLSPEMRTVFDAVVMPGREPSEPPEAWCQRFLADFGAQSDAIVHIEPAARSTLYADPIFRPWRDRCPTIALNRQDWDDVLTPGKIEDLRLSPLPGGGNYPEYTYGARNFRLYEADVDNDPSNGLEILFYAEGVYNHWEAVTALKLPIDAPSTERDWNDVLPPERVPNKLLRAIGKYNFVDLNECEVGDSRPMGISTRRAFYEPGQTYNGLIRYKSRVYIYEVFVGHFEDHWGYFLSLQSMFRYGGRRYTVGGVCGAEAPE
jgi:hypothetical protein